MKTQVGYYNTLRFYFLSHKCGGTLKERLFTLTQKAYERCFGVSGNVGHIIVSLGDNLWEVTEAGAVKVLCSPEFIKNKRVCFIWERSITEDEADTIEDVLDRQVTNSHHLNLWECFVYMLKLKLADLVGYRDIQEDETVTHAKVDGSTLKFNLPYTCVTPALLALVVVEEDDICPDDHLPAVLLYRCICDSVVGDSILWII
jgi:hypothetical protein